MSLLDQFLSGLANEDAPREDAPAPKSKLDEFLSNLDAPQREDTPAPKTKLDEFLSNLDAPPREPLKQETLRSFREADSRLMPAQAPQTQAPQTEAPRENFTARPLAAYKDFVSNKDDFLFPKLRAKSPFWNTVLGAGRSAIGLLAAPAEAFGRPLVGMPAAVADVSPTYKEKVFDPWKEWIDRGINTPVIGETVSGPEKLVRGVGMSVAALPSLLGRTAKEMVKANNPIGQEIEQATGTRNAFGQFRDLYKNGYEDAEKLPTGYRIFAEAAADPTNLIPFAALGMRAGMAAKLGPDYIHGLRPGLTAAKASKPIEEMNLLERVFAGAPKAADAYSAADLGMAPLPKGDFKSLGGLGTKLRNLMRLTPESAAFEKSRDAVDVLNSILLRDDAPEQVVKTLNDLTVPERAVDLPLGKTLAGRRTAQLVKKLAGLPEQALNEYKAAQPKWEQLKKAAKVADYAAFSKFLETADDVSKWGDEATYELYKSVKNVPRSAEHFRARLMDEMTSTLAEEAAKLYGVTGGNKLTQIRNIIKNSSNALFLADNPMYVLNNVLNNAVMMPTVGLFGNFFTDAEKTFARFGMHPAIAEQALGGPAGGAASKGATKLLQEGLQKGAAAGTESAFLGKVEKATEFAAKAGPRLGGISNKAEGVFRKQATASGLIKAWNSGWKFGRNIPDLPPELLEQLDPQTVKHIRSAIMDSMSVNEVVDKLYGKKNAIVLAMDGLTEGQTELLRSIQPKLDEYVAKHGAQKGVLQFLSDAEVEGHATHEAMLKSVLERDALALKQYGKDAGYGGIWGTMHDTDTSYREFFDNVDEWKNGHFALGEAGKPGWPALNNRIGAYYDRLISDNSARQDQIVKLLIADGIPEDVAKQAVPDLKKLATANKKARSSGGPEVWEEYSKLIRGERARANDVLANAIYGTSPDASALAQKMSAIEQAAGEADQALKAAHFQSLPTMTEADEITAAWAAVQTQRSDLWRGALQEKTQALAEFMAKRGGSVTIGGVTQAPTRTGQDVGSELAKVLGSKERASAAIVRNLGVKTFNWDDPKVIAEAERIIATRGLRTEVARVNSVVKSYADALGVPAPQVTQAPPKITLDFPMPMMDRTSLETKALSFLQDYLPQMAGYTGATLDDMPTSANAALRRYLTEDLTPAMYESRMAAIKLSEYWGNQALLDYTRRSGFHDAMSYLFPYEFWYTTSALNWARTFVSKPNYLAQLARAKRELNDLYDDPGFPSRLKGKMKFSMPFLPDWMGDTFVDPLNALGLPFNSWLQPLENIEYGTQRAQAQKALDEAIKRGDNPEKIEELRRAVEETPPADLTQSLALMSSMNPVASALLAALGMGPKVGPLWAGGRLIRQVSTALGKPVDIEAAVRSKMPESVQNVFPVKGQWDSYRVERELSNMAADKTFTAQEINKAMIEHAGPAWDEAMKRAAQQEVYGSTLKLSAYPTGEKEQRRLASEIGALYDKGDKDAISAWYDAHPEYTSRRMLFQQPGERWKGEGTQQIWDLPELTRAQLWKQFPDEMERLKAKTHTYEDVARLADAAGIKLPDMAQPVSGEKPVPFVGQPVHEKAKPLKTAPEQVQAYEQFKAAMATKYGKDIGSRAFAGEKSVDVELYERDRDRFYNENPEIAVLVGKPDTRLTEDQRKRELDFAISVNAKIGKSVWAALDKYYMTRNLFGDQAAYKILKDNPAIEAYWEMRDDYRTRFPDIQMAKGVDLRQEEKDKHIRETKLKFGRDIYDKQTEYYRLKDKVSSAAAKAYLAKTPELSGYWAWERKWDAENPAISKTKRQ